MVLQALLGDSAAQEVLHPLFRAKEHQLLFVTLVTRLSKASSSIICSVLESDLVREGLGPWASELSPAVR